MEPIPEQRGYVFDETYLQLDLYRLLASVFASEEYYKLARDEDKGPIFDEFIDSIEDREIERSLISSAISLRMILDRWRAELRPYSDELRCGIFRRYTSQISSIPLTLREACNCIIHSEKEYVQVDNHNNPTKLLPQAEFDGEIDGIRWHATLDMIRYVYGGLRLLKHKGRLNLH